MAEWYSMPFESNFGKHLLDEDSAIEVRSVQWGVDVPFDWSSLPQPDELTGDIIPTALAPTVGGVGFDPWEPVMKEPVREAWCGYAWGQVPSIDDDLDFLKGKVGIGIAHSIDGSPITFQLTGGRYVGGATASGAPGVSGLLFNNGNPASWSLTTLDGWKIRPYVALLEPEDVSAAPSRAFTEVGFTFYRRKIIY